MRTAADLGTGGGAIALALIDHLINSNFLTPDDAKGHSLLTPQNRSASFPDGIEGASRVERFTGRSPKTGRY